MSIRRFHIVFCDLCDDHSFDEPQEDTPSARELLAQQGWRRVLGFDLCPNHELLDSPRKVRDALQAMGRYHREVR